MTHLLLLSASTFNRLVSNNLKVRNVCLNTFGIVSLFQLYIFPIYNAIYRHSITAQTYIGLNIRLSKSKHVTNQSHARITEKQEKIHLAVKFRVILLRCVFLLNFNQIMKGKLEMS